MDSVQLSSASLTARIKLHGAELCSLQKSSGDELIWQAGPQWPRHAPVLFPIVGRLSGDLLRVNDRSYSMTQHGFARDMRFELVGQTSDSVTLELRDNAATFARFPFSFVLRITYRLRAHALLISYLVHNPGEEALPFSLGAHPAFNWPLPGNADKQAHAVTFELPEPAPVRRLANGLMRAMGEPSPVEGRRLALNEVLFADDAIIFDNVSSRQLTYQAPNTPVISLEWSGFGELGIWSKPSGAGFICLEPWCGYASPEGFDGDIFDKPGVVILAPQDEWAFSIDIKIS